MKNKFLYVLVATMCLPLTNCNDNDDSQNFVDAVEVTSPVIKTKSEIRSSISIVTAQPTNSDGKIYVYDKLLFYIAQNSGIHIFDNQNPEVPENKAFIQLEGVHDISVKNNILYADNYMDLVVFDISNLSDIQLVNTEEDILSYYAVLLDETDYFMNVYPSGGDEFIASYETIYMEREEVDNNSDIYYRWDNFIGVLETANSTNIVGTGGSYAKFQIYNNALYTLDNSKLSTFNIADYNNISSESEVYPEGNWGVLETTFIQQDLLFIGATNGMHIVSLQNELNPVYLSSFLHATGCDPVVVDGDTAYITIRGGNTCGAVEDQINIIDITDITAPTEYSTYFLSSPYGLGVKNQILYVCNDTGINVFDVQNPEQITLVNTYETTVKDVVSLPSHLIAVGENVIYQYNYVDNLGLELINTIQF